MPDYVANDCECNATTEESDTTPALACNCEVTEEGQALARSQNRKRIWKEVGRSSAHRTSMMASMVVAKAGQPTGLGIKHASYARYLAKKKGKIIDVKCCS